jgi:DNA-directed RNA polymerase specialized sigma24 family protein
LHGSFQETEIKAVIRTSDDKDIFDVLPFEEPNPEKDDQTDKQRKVMEMISVLPKDQQDVVILRHLQT